MKTVKSLILADHVSKIGVLLILRLNQIKKSQLEFKIDVHDNLLGFSRQRACPWLLNNFLLFQKCIKTDQLLISANKLSD